MHSTLHASSVQKPRIRSSWLHLILRHLRKASFSEPLGTLSEKECRRRREDIKNVVHCFMSINCSLI